jgi:hypothetical protein
MKTSTQRNFLSATLMLALLLVGPGAVFAAPVFQTVGPTPPDGTDLHPHTHVSRTQTLSYHDHHLGHWVRSGSSDWTFINVDQP